MVIKSVVSEVETSFAVKFDVGIAVVIWQTGCCLSYDSYTG